MSYCTKAQCKSMFRNLEDAANPEVTDTDIDEFIEEADGIINSRLKGIYALPITGPESLVVLRGISRLLVAAKMDDILNTYAEADKKPTYNKTAMDFLNEIAPKVDPKTGKRPAPSAFLPDSDYLGTEPAGNSIAVEAVSGRTFQKGVDSW